MTTDTQDVRMPVDLVCPHTGESFTPEYITTPAGHVVAAPIQTSPGDPSKQMVSAYGVASGTATPTVDIPLARNTSAKFDLGRNFANKLWNATRFALKRVDSDTHITTPVDVSDRPFADRWILAQLTRTVGRLEQALEHYHFNSYADTLYDFVWHDVCDRYLEMVKPTIDDDADQQAVLAAVLDAVVRIMHPVCPFVTEALWPHIRAARCGDVNGLTLPDSELLAGASWPLIDLDDADAIDTWQRAEQLVSAIRAVRGAQAVPPKRMITVHAPDATHELIARTGGVVQVLAGIGTVAAIDGERPAVVSPITFEGTEILLSGLVDDIDLGQERERLQKIVDGKTKQIGGFRGRLANEGFLNNAKPEVVDETRRLLAAAEADLEAAAASLDRLG